MSRPTLQQLEALADFLELNPGIAKGLLRTALAKITTKRKWEQISTAINALGGAQKDGKGWAKYWADKKCSLKKVCGQHAQSIRRTGGGPAEALPILTPIDQRLVAVMGGLEFAAGDRHVAINPLPTPNITSSLAVSVQNSEMFAETPPMAVHDYAAEAVYSETVNTKNIVSSERERSPVKIAPTLNRRRSRALQETSLNEDRNQFAAIEQQRVKAETVTAQALREAVANISSVAIAINNLAAAVTEAAQIIAQAVSSSRPHTN